MTSLAETVDLVIGVDTHKHTHTAAIVVAGTGAVLEDRMVPTDPEGFAALVAMADAHPGMRAWRRPGTARCGGTAGS